MKIFVFGATGMLGKYVHRNIRESIPVGRKDVDALLIRNDIFHEQLDRLKIGTDDVVINCMGITNKQNCSVDEFIVVNSLFPRLLADYCEDRLARMIHISTDCVYSGKKGLYVESDRHDEENIYGLSKSTGEPANCTVIRTSIVGENNTHSRDLLEWVRGFCNSTITGYTNHIWNGITCLQFAKICEQIIHKNLFWWGVRHIFSPEDVTKATLVAWINAVYGLNNVIQERDSDTARNMTLRSDYDGMFAIPSIMQQLIEQKDFILNK